MGDGMCVDCKLYASGLNPRPESLFTVSWERVGSVGRPVTVLAEECDECGGRDAGSWVVLGTFVSSSSGFAMRKPPNDWDKLRSPFMMKLEAVESGEVVEAPAAQVCGFEGEELRVLSALLWRRRRMRSEQHHTRGCLAALAALRRWCQAPVQATRTRINSGLR